MISSFKSFISHPPSLAVGIVFSVNSILFGSWVTRIPEVQNKLEITKSELGVALLMLAIGAFLIMPMMAWIMAKFTTGRTMFLASVG